MHTATITLHFVALVNSSSLLTFYSIVIIQLTRSKPPDCLCPVSGNQLNFVTYVRTDEALNQYLRKPHSRKSVSDIEAAIEVYKELAGKY